MSNEDLLTTMFAVHGKRAMDAQFNEYLKIFDRLGNEKAKKIFQHVRDHEDRFPTIKQLWGIVNSLGLTNKTPSHLRVYDDCYYCGGVGYVPFLISPKRDKRVNNYNTEMYACKCSAGQDVPDSMKRYFETFKELQFDEVIDGHNYPQLITRKQQNFSDQLHKENNYVADTNPKTNQRHTSTLDNGNLRKELKTITERNFETKAR